MVLTLIGLRPDLETVRDHILGSSSVPFLDDVFARLLRISSTQTLPSDNTSDSSVLISQTNSRGGRSGNRGRGQRPHCTYCNKLGHTRDRCYQLHGRPPRTAHVAQSSDPQPPQPPSSSTSQGISLTDSEYDDYLRYQATKSASVAQIGNPSSCLTHTSSWDIPDFKRVIVVIPLRLITTFSPLMSLSLRTHRSSPSLSLFLFLKSYPFP